MVTYGSVLYCRGPVLVVPHASPAEPSRFNWIISLRKSLKQNFLSVGGHAWQAHVEIARKPEECLTQCLGQ